MTVNINMRVWTHANMRVWTHAQSAQEEGGICCTRQVHRLEASGVVTKKGSL